MNAVLRRRLEIAVRVRDFLRAHKLGGPGDAEALTRIEELVTRAQALIAQQIGGVMVARTATVQRAEIRRALETKLLRYLEAAGAVAARGNAQLSVEFHFPRQLSHQAFLANARRMLERGTALKEQLVKEGMSATLLDDLTAALAEFASTLEASRTGRREHPSLRSGQVVGASADLEAVAVEIVERVRLLDGLVKYRFGDNPELMGAWASARNVLGPFRTKAQPEPEAGGGETPKAA